MERNVRHVQRWLERCLEAYRHRRHGAALAELESARAELEIAREKLSEEMAGAKTSSPFQTRRCCRIAMTALVFLLALALPTARRADLKELPLFSADLARRGSLRLVTEEEKALLENLRKTPVTASVPREQELSESFLSPPAVEAVAVRVTAKGAEGEKAPEVPEVSLPPDTSARKSDGGDSDKLKKIESAPSVEEVLSLLQTGQRALRHPGKGIPIQP